MGRLCPRLKRQVPLGNHLSIRIATTVKIKICQAIQPFHSQALIVGTLEEQPLLKFFTPRQRKPLQELASVQLQGCF